MSNNDRIRRVSINALTNYLRFFFTMVVSFWLIPFIIGTLGPAAYGLWNLSFSIIGFFSLLDFGFGLGVVKWTGETSVTGEIEYRNHMLSTIFFVYVIIALVGLVLLTVFAFFYPTLFAIDSELAGIAVAVLLILGIRSLAIQIPLSLFKGALFGEQKIHLINIIQMLGTLVYAGSAWFALSHGKNIVWLAALNCASFLVENLFYVLFAYRNVKGLHISPNMIRKKYFREAMGFSFYSFLTTIAGLVLFQTDSIIIQLILGLEFVGLYAVAIKVTEYSFLLTKQLVNVLTPLISELKAKQEDETIRYLLLDLSKYIMATGFLITGSVYVFARELLVFWVDEYFAVVTIPLILLITSFVIAVPELVASNVLTMTGHHRFSAVSAGLSTGINIVTSLLLIRPLGLTGVALGTVISSFVVSTVVVPAKAANVYHFSYMKYITRVYLPAAIPTLALVGTGMLMKYLFPVHSLWDMMVKAVPGIVVYIVIFWFSFTDTDIQAKITGKIARLYKR
ncbi:MAG: oligosaccharide flippase family protein [Sphaerochaetaceae bacterium]